jgi:hypothetical protein
MSAPASEARARWPFCVVKGLDPYWVARSQQLPLFLVPQYKGKHPLQVVNTVLTPRLVGVQDHFVIGAGVKPMPQRFQAGAQGGEVVNLPVADYPDRFVFVVHRLVAQGAQVYDGQPPMPQPGAARRRGPFPGVVGTTMRQGVQ